MARSKKEFGEGPIYTITNYIYWLFMGSLYFILMNIPLLFILLTLLSLGNNPLPEGFGTVLFVCCIPIGPAATALLSVMGKLVRDKDVSITKDFFKAYKTNFLQALFLWVIEMAILVILVTDAKIFASSGFPIFLAYLMYGLAALVFLMGLYIFPILSRFYMKSKDIVKLSAYYCIKKLPITFLNLCSFLIVGFVFTKFSFIIVFAASLIAFMIMYYEQKILAEIEIKMNPEAAEASESAKAEELTSDSAEEFSEISTEEKSMDELSEKPNDVLPEDSNRNGSSQ